MSRRIDIPARAKTRFRSVRGFSIAELMVAIVVGLLAVVFATRLVAGSEQNRQAALGGSDSMQNGMVAMFSISGDAAQAGWGLNDPITVGCDTVFSDSGGFQLASAPRGPGMVHPMAAAVIQSNGSAPDSITLYAGSSISGTGTLRIVSDYSGGSRLDVDRVPYGFAQGDVILVAPETVGAGRCALAQISNDTSKLAPPPAQQFLLVEQGGDARYNQSAGLGETYRASQSRLFNLGPAGNLAFHTWSVANGFLQLRSTDLAGASSAPSTVMDNVVSIKAQYGFDTRAGSAFNPQTGMQIGQWSATMVDADKDGVAGSTGDWQRVAALRLAVVARSRAPERAKPGQSCSATLAKPRVFAAAEPAGVDAVPIDVDVAVAGDPVDWHCYRYRVFETIVQLRNAAWRPTAWKP